MLLLDMERAPAPAAGAEVAILAIDADLPEREAGASPAGSGNGRGMRFEARSDHDLDAALGRPKRNGNTTVKHWLITVARSAGVGAAESLFAAASLQIEDAWTTVADACQLSDDALAGLVAAHYRLGIADLDDGDPDLTQRVPERIARKYGILPLREDDGHLVIATSDPTDHDAEQALRFASRKRPIFEVASPASLRSLINSRYSSDRMVEMLLGRVDGDLSDVRVVEEVGPESVAGEEADAAPIIKLTNVILVDAVREGASDIHLEPAGNGGVVRFRVDGVLRHHMQVPQSALNRVISRIKVMGDLDIADRLRPQDGRTRIQLDGRVHDLRISTVPTRQTEKAVIRILHPEGNRTLDDLQMPDSEISRLRQLLGFRDGITVVTGPTGSGKTTTLYAALREVATGEVNVMSVEDPVEYELHGITQIQVEVDRGVTFASALRAILRQDPDIIFIGEIRDAETAEIAVHASMTGHLVLATLHTNDAVSAVARLEQLGLDAPSIASTMRGAIAQRLLRRVCAHCAQTVGNDLTTEESRLAELFGIAPLVRPRGCKRCTQSGFRGRLPVVEVMISDARMRELIQKEASFSELYRSAVSGGMRSMLRTALERVRTGQTTLQEVQRVVGSPHDDLIAGPGELLDDAADLRRPEDLRLFAVDDAKQAAGAG
jgi:type II secretory ATPase GspE/PulE/Tfp pilus assembly ATPase PilB-like protein